MSDPSQATPPPAAPSFQSVPTNPAAAMGAAGGYFGSTAPAMLAIHALLAMVAAALLSFIGSFFRIIVLSNVLDFVNNVLQAVGMVVLVVAGARFVADAFRGR